MVDCPPLAWAVHSIYSEFRDEIEVDLKAALVSENRNHERIDLILGEAVSQSV